MLVKKILRKLTYPLSIAPKPHHDEGSSYADTHLDSTKGTNYESGYQSNLGQKLYYEIEKPILRKIFNDVDSAASYLDFAAGTGRISILAADFLEDITLIDVSASMLDVAEERFSKVNIYCQDFRDENSKICKSFDLITAFRFFANAEPQLRDDAFDFISRHLKKNGLFVFNNHRNFWSIPYFLGRVFLLRYPYGMTHKEVALLAEKNGFEFVRCISFGVLPYNEKKTLLPWGVNKVFEKFYVKSWFRNLRLGSNVVYVFKKT